jgi:flagellar hook-basal body complex protein FliE
MDLTLGKVLPSGFADQAGKLAEQLRSAAPGVAPRIEDPTLSRQITNAGEQATNVGGSGVFESFSKLLNQALQDVNQVQQAADVDAQRLVAGEPVDVHQVMIGMEKANVAFGLTLQVRNKLVEAYQEVMRMQV